jgi:hypothetical protein
MMSNEAVSRLSGERSAAQTSQCAYQSVKTIDEIAQSIQQITKTQTQQVALVTVMVSFENSGAWYGPTYTSPESSTLALLNSLRPRVRKTDVVFLHEYTIYFLLPGCTIQGGQIVQARLWDILLWRMNNAVEEESILPCDVAIGHSAYPAPCSNVYEFIETSTEMCLCTNFLPERSLHKPLRRQNKNAQNGSTEVLPALARKLGIPYLSLLPRTPLAQVQQLMNPQLAKALRCYPLGRERNMLTVAISNPENSAILDQLRQETGLQIFPVLAPPEELQSALEQLI